MNQSRTNRSTKAARPAKKSRAAFLLVEMMICFVFLAVAAGMAVNLHRSRIEYDRKAIDHLRTELMLENVGERLRSVPFDELDDATGDLQNEYPVRIKVNEFQSGSTGGLHFVIQPANEPRSTLQHHVWRLEQGQ